MIENRGLELLLVKWREEGAAGKMAVCAQSSDWERLQEVGRQYRTEPNAQGSAYLPERDQVQFMMQGQAVHNSCLPGLERHKVHSPSHNVREMHKNTLGDVPTPVPATWEQWLSPTCDKPSVSLNSSMARWPTVDTVTWVSVTLDLVQIFWLFTP